MMPTTICFICKHYKGDRKCKAFPEKIPKEIFFGEKDHTKKFKGDNGITFEAKKK